MARRTFKKLDLSDNWYMGETLCTLQGQTFTVLKLINAASGVMAAKVLHSTASMWVAPWESKRVGGTYVYEGIGLIVEPLKVTQVSPEVANELRLKQVL